MIIVMDAQTEIKFGQHYNPGILVVSILSLEVSMG
jgi:hypothetical protein